LRSKLDDDLEVERLRSNASPWRQSRRDTLNMLNGSRCILRVPSVELLSTSTTSISMPSIATSIVVRDMISRFEVNERFYEIGSPEGLEETHALLEARARATT
jgi:hypothetical protein